MFLQMVLLDMESWCCTSTARDRKTIESRVKHEGLSFLTITLPNFGGELQKALDQGYVSSNQFAGFRRTGGLPRFLGGFLQNVFDSESGALLQNPDINSIWALRQFTLMFAKISSISSDERKKKAMSGYMEIELELRSRDRLSRTRQDSNVFTDIDFQRMVTLVWPNVLSEIDSDVYY